MVAADLNEQLEKAYEELRGIDANLSSLTGRSLQDRVNRKRLAPTDNGVQVQSSFGSNERRVQEGGRRLIISTPNTDRFGNRRAANYVDDSQAIAQSDSFREYSPPTYKPPPKRSLASSVVMPTIETKSRAATINEMKKNETAEDSNRNRRMFANLLVGTLRQFQKEENSANNKQTAQFEKQRDIERRLEQTDLENKNKIKKEREELMARRREKELEILSLRRKKAIQQYAEEKLQHFKRLQCFIQTQTKPPLFFLPAKHTLRTLELLKDSSRKVETLIELRREEMERELRRDVTDTADVDEGTDGGDTRPPSNVVTNNNSGINKFSPSTTDTEAISATTNLKTPSRFSKKERRGEKEDEEEEEDDDDVGEREDEDDDQDSIGSDQHEELGQMVEPPSEDQQNPPPFSSTIQADLVDGGRAQNGTGEGSEGGGVRVGATVGKASLLKKEDLLDEKIEEGDGQHVHAVGEE